MHPAPSVIAFTVFSGFGFGLMVFLGLGWPAPRGTPAFLWWGLAYACAVGGLTASTLHLGNPERALMAFSQWRSSWLSREAWAAVATLILCAPTALSDWLGLGWPRLPGHLGALAALAILSQTELLLIILAGLFVMETGSVIMNRTYFKLTKGKRIWLASPIHHHFEIKGWAEITVVVRFWIISGLFAAIGVGAFYLEWLSR